MATPRYYKPIIVNAPEGLRKKIEKEAKEQDRKLGPTLCEIARRYFEQKENGTQKRTPRA